MAIYLVQHGKNLPEDIDPEKGLSDQGISDTERIASVAAGYNVCVSRVVHSGKKRAKETAEILAGALKAEKTEIMNGMNPKDSVRDFAKDITSDNTLYTGHLPFMEKLAAYLVTGNESPPIFKFQNSGIVCLEKTEDNKGWIIKWALMPNVG